ncbi:MAG: undecaprenyl-diphosphatase UppP [Chloroflexi bacterium]|nr:undecaprenyl-diphosphatase UppP [Chloroflexota bacterium]
MQLSLFQAAVLGVVQGLAEFLPISSSGHLILVPWLLGWPDQSLTFDLALHLGTTAALLGYFWRDWLTLARAFLAGLVSAAGREAPAWRLVWMLILGCLPAGVAGLLFENVIEQKLRQPWLVASMLIAFGIVLLVADRLARRVRALDQIGFADALIVGCAQTLALVPGVSRSGITLTAGLLRGLDRPAAARFSFLLSAPITLAAAVYKLRVLFRAPPTGEEAIVFVVGVATAAIVGALAIGFLLRYLQRSSTAIFVWYRVAAGVGILTLALGTR